MTFPLFPWEEPSWRARSAILLLENLRHTGIWIVHGAWDRAVGGGVDVAHSRNSAAGLEALGIPHRYTELPETGHGALGAAGSDLALAGRPALAGGPAPAVRPDPPDADHLRAAPPRRRLGRGAAAGALRGPAGAGRRQRRSPERWSLRTENVRRLLLGPVPVAGASTALRVDGAPRLRRRPAGPGRSPAAPPRRGLGGRRRGAPRGREAPRPCAGPFGDLFRRGVVLVTGTTGSAEERFFLEWSAQDGAGFFRTWNGGVHRGGIAGESRVDLPRMTDAEYLAAGDTTRNVIAFGTPATNALLAAPRRAPGPRVRRRT